MTAQVFWDGYGLDQPHSGVSVYARKLAEGLIGLGAYRPIVITDRPGAAGLPLLDHLVLTAGVLPHALRRIKPLWPQLVGQTASGAAKGTYVVHGLSNFNVPILSADRRQRRVLTVHDLIPFLAPESVSKSLVWQLRVLFGPAVRQAHHIICVSHWTKNCLIERFPDVEPKTSVIHHGRPQLIEVSKDSSGAIDILSVARGESYKRLDLLIAALRQMPKNFRLTIVTSVPARENLAKMAPDLLQENRLFLRSNVDDSSLRELYAKAQVVAQPSLYEGYGFPVIEGLAHSCAVVFTRGTAMDELLDRSVSVAVDAAGGVGEWAKGLQSAALMVSDHDWHSRVKVAHNRLPTWADVALAVQKIYGNLLAG